MSFHLEYIRCGKRPAHVGPLYLFHYGFGLWIWRRIFSCGWDVNSQPRTQEPK
jgi:hypothetical protein